MKKLSVLIMLLATASVCFGQNETQKITGLGKLKLGDPVSVLDGLGYKNGGKIDKDKPFYYYTYDNSNSKKYFEIVADTTLKYLDYNAKYDNRVKSFLFPKYEIINGLFLEGMILRFFNGALYEISSSNASSDLNDALTLKYGEPKTKTETKDNQFVNQLTGATITKTDIAYYFTYETGDSDIVCRYTLDKYYDSKGKENYLSIFVLEKTSVREEVDNTDKATRERLKAKEKDLKKKNLDGL